MIHTSIKNIET